MVVLIFLFGLLLAMGLFFILSDFLKLPRLATGRAMQKAKGNKKDKMKTTDAYILSISLKLYKWLPMDPYKKSRLKNTLKAAGLHPTPEEFIAFALVKAMMVALGVIPCLMVLPFISPFVIFLSILIYFKEIKKADDLLKEKRGKIESELPRFVATLTQELKVSRDVLGMLSHYKQSAGETFAKELDIVTADMRSSSYEAALTRFESRINSPMLSDITRGLIGVLRGDDSSVYFQMLAHDMKQLELQRLKAQALKIPPKIRVFSFIMLMCFILTYIAIIVYEILRSLTGMF